MPYNIIAGPPDWLMGGHQGRGNAKNRLDGPFWLNEPMRHQRGSRSHPCLDHNDSQRAKEVSTPGTNPAFTRLLCVFNQDLQYITHVQPHRYMTHTYTHTNGRLLFILRVAVKCKQSPESQ